MTKALNHTTVARDGRRPAGHAGGRAGFTVMELLIVVSCIGILMAIVAPKFYQITGRYRLDEATMMTASDLRQAVSLAAREQKPVTILLETSSRYVVKDRATSPADTVRLRRNMQFSRDAGARSVSFSPSSVTVFPNGVLDAALTVTLASDGYSRQVTMSAAGQVRVVPAP